jgi:hypothetical protein
MVNLIKKPLTPDHPMFTESATVFSPVLIGASPRSKPQTHQTDASRTNEPETGTCAAARTTPKP